jgi:hypothetical protein
MDEVFRRYAGLSLPYTESVFAKGTGANNEKALARPDCHSTRSVLIKHSRFMWAHIRSTAVQRGYKLSPRFTSYAKSSLITLSDACMLLRILTRGTAESDTKFAAQETNKTRCCHPVCWSAVPPFDYSHRRLRGRQSATMDTTHTKI